METGRPTDGSLSAQLTNNHDTLRRQLLEDPVQRQIWGVSPDNLDAVFNERSELFLRLKPLLEQFCKDEHIQGSLEQELWHIYLPFAQWIIQRAKGR